MRFFRQGSPFSHAKHSALGKWSQLSLMETGESCRLLLRQPYFAKVALQFKPGQPPKELYIGASTVKTHTQRLYEKLGVSDRAAAVAEAMRRGLLE